MDLRSWLILLTMSIAALAAATGFRLGRNASRKAFATDLAEDVTSSGSEVSDEQAIDSQIEPLAKRHM